MIDPETLIFGIFYIVVFICARVSSRREERRGRWPR